VKTVTSLKHNTSLSVTWWNTELSTLMHRCLKLYLLLLKSDVQWLDHLCHNITELDHTGTDPVVRKTAIAHIIKNFEKFNFCKLDRRQNVEKSQDDVWFILSLHAAFSWNNLQAPQLIIQFVSNMFTLPLLFIYTFNDVNNMGYFWWDCKPRHRKNLKDKCSHTMRVWMKNKKDMQLNCVSKEEEAAYFFC
jgi:hypothetical protein